MYTMSAKQGKECMIHSSNISYKVIMARRNYKICPECGIHYDEWDIHANKECEREKTEGKRRKSNKKSSSIKFIIYTDHKGNIYYSNY